MAKQPKTPKPAKHVPSPEEYGYTPEQLCRVVSKHGIKLERGTLLARRGAWQNKSVVTHVSYMGTEESLYHVVNNQPVIYDVYTVGVEFLGLYYASGTCKPAMARKEREVREFVVKVEAGKPMTHGLGGYDGGMVPVVPAPDVVQKVLVVDKSQVAAEKAAKTAQTKAAMAAYQKSPQAVIGGSVAMLIGEPVKITPAATLDQFLIK